MSTRHWIEAGASLLGGAGLGAAVMYLFDPDLGERRRQEAIDRTEGAFGSTGERLGNTWNSLSETAGQWASKASGAVSHARDKAEAYADDAVDGAASYGRGVSKAAKGYRRSAENWLGRNRPQSSGASAAEIVASAAGALVVGAGLMYLLDPSQGRRRRAMIRDKAAKTARQTSEYVESKGRHLSNKTHGIISDARHLGEAAKVESA